MNRLKHMFQHCSDAGSSTGYALLACLVLSSNCLGRLRGFRGVGAGRLQERSLASNIENTLFTAALGVGRNIPDETCGQQHQRPSAVTLDTRKKSKY